MMVIAAAATGFHAWLVQPALDDVLINSNKKMLLIIPLVIIITTFIKGISTYIHDVQINLIAHKVIAKLQNQMFSKLMFVNLSFYNDAKSGNIISRIINDANNIFLSLILPSLQSILHQLDKIILVNLEILAF